MKRLLPLLTLLAGLATPPASAQLSVYAYTDKTELGDEETLLYTLEITGDLSGLEPIRPPDARGLTLAMGHPAVQSTVVVNGRERLTLGWLYEPQRTGTATILGARIEAGGRTYRTDPVEITVVPQRQRGAASAPRASRLAPVPAPQAPSAPSGDLFIRAEPRTRRVVVGEQVVVDFVLYFAPGLRPHGSPRLATALNTDGFWREALDVSASDLHARAVTVGGEPFEAATIFRLALFPTRSGTLELGATEFEIDLVRGPRTDDPFGSLFSPFTSRFVKERVRAPAVPITVDPLPAGAPPSFHGAVGQFGLAAYTDKDAVAAGEPVEFTVEIRGTGNIATLEPPDFPTPDGFDAFDPDEARTLDRSAVPLAGAKTFTYTLVPRGGGAFEIPPVAWSYYDPETGTYETLRSATFPVEVSGAPAATAADPSAPLGMMAEVDWRRAPPPPRLPVGALLAGLALPLLALLGLVALRRRAEARAESSPEALALRAHPEAARHLQTARSRTDDPRAFYAEAEGVVRRFLAHRLALPSARLPRTALAAALAERGVALETRTAVDAFLAECERGQFAPMSGADADALAAVADRAAHLLTTVDAQAAPVGPR